MSKLQRDEAADWGRAGPAILVLKRIQPDWNRPRAAAPSSTALRAATYPAERERWSLARAATSAGRGRRAFVEEFGGSSPTMWAGHDGWWI
jgi:hypothetical protein